MKPKGRRQLIGGCAFDRQATFRKDENDPFFASIVFPDTPPPYQHGPRASPYPVPDIIRNNPHLFEVSEYGN